MDSNTFSENTRGPYVGTDQPATVTDRLQGIRSIAASIGSLVTTYEAAVCCSFQNERFWLCKLSERQDCARRHTAQAEVDRA